jgi:hypothetical protein
VHPHVGHRVEPDLELPVQIVEIAEAPTLEERRFDVAHSPLDLSLHPGPVGWAGNGEIPVVVGEIEEPLVPAHHTRRHVVLLHRLLHIVDQDTLRISNCRIPLRLTTDRYTGWWVQHRTRRTRRELAAGREREEGGQLSSNKSRISSAG